MQKVILNIGDKIEMTHTKSASRQKLSENTYRSMLLDYDGRRSARIAMPIFEGRVVPLEVEDEYELCFFSAAGLYRCNAKVIRRFREGKMHVLLVEFLTPLKKHQRRQFFRLECMQEIQSRVITEEEKTLRDFIFANKFQDGAQLDIYEEKLEEFSRNWDTVLMTDISGGGVRLQTKTWVEPKSSIEVLIPLEIEGGIIPFKNEAKVVNTIDLKSSAGVYELRCEFEQITKQQQELIVKFVFEEQKRRLRKE